VPESPDTNISSFLIRFIDIKKPADQPGAYRGVIRHIQSGDEQAFTHWREAIEFIQRFFPMEDVDLESIR
jgi:hypothetical protein